MKRRGQQFLNESYYEGGTVRWMVSTEGTDYNLLSKPDEVEAELKISDCDKIIALDFNCNNLKHLTKRVAKLDVLIEELNKMRSALLLAEKEAIAKSKRYY